VSKREDPDPMLDEIREIRKRIWREHGNDPQRVYEHYVEYQQQFSDRLVSTPTPARPKEDKSAA
jgi:hypothetical protein